MIMVTGSKYLSKHQLISSLDDIFSPPHIGPRGQALSILNPPCCKISEVFICKHDNDSAHHSILQLM